jgi:hypothetical protein
MYVVIIFAGTYSLNFRSVSASADRREVVGHDGHAHHEGAAGFDIVGVEVGEVGEVDGGRVVDLLQGTGSVEVANGNGGRVGLLLGGGRAF